VFCLDAAGVLLVEACDVHNRSVLPVAWILFLAPAWYGVWLLVLQRRTRYYRLTGLLLTAVNAAWSIWLLLGVGAETEFRSGYLCVSAVFLVLGLGIVQHSFRIRRPGRPLPR
ncbi:MAG TPA: hypothetical protein VM222_00580, partial [Planctomycetota bacterium]|nr:hypothetical protein [Planctomycetota bacterium]